MRSVFVFGFLPESPGKTVISSALARGLKNRGIRTCVFKPRSGHNLWYQHDAFLRCKKEGRLFCEDIIKLRRACGSSLPIEVLNPVDALMSPLDVRGFLERNAVSRLYLLEQDVFSHLVAERYTICKDKVKHILCVNMKALEPRFVMTDLEYIRKLKEHADKILYLNSLDEWSSIFKDYGPKAIRSCYRKISEEADYLIVEGFNDAVCPEKSLRYDLVIGVAPGIAVFYDAEDFHAIIETLQDLGKDPRSLRAENVIKYLQKMKVLPIPALPSSYIKDYDALSKKLNRIVDLTLQLTHRS